MRIAMYWHNGRSLGHTAEVSKISGALVNNLPEHYFYAGITGAFKGLDMFLPKIDIVKLPGFSNYDRKEGWNFMGNQGLPVNELFEVRSRMIRLFMEAYDPEIFIVNHIITGLNDELLPTLNLPKNGIRVLTLRGVLFDKEKTEKEYFKGEALDILLENYDYIFVHIDPNIFSLEENYEIPLHIKTKIKYTGYLTPKRNLTQKQARELLGIMNDDRIVVASMAGGQGAINIWHALIDSLEKNSVFFDRCYFITGPYLELEDKIKLREISEKVKWLQIIEYVSDMQAWITAADLFIGAAGSSMLGEIITTNSNSIVIPRQVREVEQFVHATELSKRGLVRMCSLQNTLDREIEKEIEDAFRNPFNSSQHDIMVGGVNYYAKLLMESYENR